MTCRYFDEELSQRGHWWAHRLFNWLSIDLISIKKITKMNNT